MREYLPLIIPCAIIGVFTLVFLCAYAVLKKKTAKETSERHMPDSEIIRRLLRYAAPYKKEFALIFFIMLVSIAYDVVSPLLVATIQGTIKQSFQLSRLFILVAVYAGILAVSMVCTYFQAMILQKIGQKILTQLRMDTFTHIEQLSHAQLNQIPVGKLVTRVTNDPNSISYLFTNILVTLAKNSLVILGVLGGMLMLNYALTLMVLCFVPFLVFFTLVFQNRQYPGVNPHQLIKLRQGEAALDGALDLGHQQRRHHIVGNGNKHDDKDQQKVLFIGGGIPGQSHDDLPVGHVPLAGLGLGLLFKNQVGNQKNQGKQADDGTDDQ